ncbi:toxin-antitoxin system YwqK family antitoxin [Maridesulfovibrio hydrothermalis]|uniref:MORN variant repeat protein n=1 Tax=Maridesulfovibrio hydrothermalis AM13 = DSM 14728 TaxID=1121451 RepID=L0RAB1_9BACT|nr:MORN variant repeat protein [Maridesulfovibrio hydrothermalis]CCO23152.1 MORN variant repeat protein [Maridesulfovibrio hydrothermalis AM13 = DSM 14728]
MLKPTITTLFILLCLTLSGCGQQEATFYDLIFEQDLILSKDDNEPFSGIYVEYYDLDRKKPKHRIEVDDGIFQGKFYHYYSSGSLHAEGTNKNGRFYGYHKVYWENGKLKQKIYFARDKAGYDYEYYESGQLSDLRHYNSEGQLHGRSFTFHRNGRIKEEKSYKNGNKNGMFLTKSPEGKLITIYSYKDGMLQEYARTKNKSLY